MAIDCRDDAAAAAAAPCVVAAGPSIARRAGSGRPSCPSWPGAVRHGTAERRRSSAWSGHLDPDRSSSCPVCRASGRAAVAAPGRVARVYKSHTRTHTDTRTPTHLYPDHHVQVALRVLLDDVAHIVRLARLLELAPCHEILDFPYRPDSVPMGVRQSRREA